VEGLAHSRPPQDSSGVCGCCLNAEKICSELLSGNGVGDAPRRKWDPNGRIPDVFGFIKYVPRAQNPSSTPTLPRGADCQGLCPNRPTRPCGEISNSLYRLMFRKFEPKKTSARFHFHSSYVSCTASGLGLSYRCLYGQINRK
jgi:hypothetical protein